MSTKRATYPVEVKAVGDSGQITALVSVFNNIDLQGDRVVPGAFTKSIAAWKSSADPVPVIFSHEWGDIWSHIGVVDSMQETADGLLATYTLDINDNPVAAQVFKLLKRRSLKEHSFAYDVVNEQRAKDGAMNLMQLDIIEIGPTLKGANPSTELIAVKSAVEAEQARRASSLSGRKVWVDAELPGSFDEIRESICDAVVPLFNPAADQNIYVSVQAVYPEYALIEVCQEGADDATYHVPYTIDGDTATLGEPTAVEVTVSVTPKSASQKKMPQSLKTEINSIATGMVAENDRHIKVIAAENDQHAKAVANFNARMQAVAGTDIQENSGEPKSALSASTTPDESDATAPDDATEGPSAKSHESVLALHTRILEMRATTGVTAA